MTSNATGRRRWLAWVALGLLGCAHAPPVRLALTESAGRVVTTDSDGSETDTSVGERTTVSLRHTSPVIDRPIVIIYLEAKNTSADWVHLGAGNITASVSGHLSAKVLSREDAIAAIERSSKESRERALAYFHTAVQSFSLAIRNSAAEASGKATGERIVAATLQDQVNSSYWTDIDLQPSQSATGIVTLELLDDVGRGTIDSDLLLVSSIGLDVSVDSDVHRFVLSFHKAIP